MNDARRFLRYVIPGIVFAIEAGILMCCLFPGWASLQISAFQKDSGVGFLIAAVAASGGLGLIFSSIHQCIHWRKGREMIDHRLVIKRLVDNRILRLQEKVAEHLSCEEAWIIYSTLWHQRLKDNKRIESAAARADDMVDIMHSMGTARVASVTAVIFVPAFAIMYHLQTDGLSWFGCGIALFITIVTFFTFHLSYYRSARMTQGLLDEMLSDALVAECSKSGPPIVTWPLFK
jgi:hypothetical protein